MKKYLEILFCIVAVLIFIIIAKSEYECLDKGGVMIKYKCIKAEEIK